MTLVGVPRGGQIPDEDRYSTWDAAYVLGSLADAERREYESHLATCPRCRTAVAELSGMPALLGQLDLQEVQTLEADQPRQPPLRPEVLDSVLAKLRWRRRRSLWLASAAAALAAAVLVVAVVIAVRPGVLGPEPQQQAVDTIEMTEVAPSPFNATVSVTSYAWGTRIDMACTYGQWSGAAEDAPSTLGMVVVGHDGSRTEVATWLGVTGATALPSANTPMSKDDIAAIQLVVAGDDQVLLETRL